MHAIKNVTILTPSLIPRPIYPVIQNVMQMHGEKVGGRGGGLVRKMDKWCKPGNVAHNFI